jgi:hypothetical protein
VSDSDNSHDFDVTTFHKRSARNETHSGLFEIVSTDWSTASCTTLWIQRAPTGTNLLITYREGKRSSFVDGDLSRYRLFRNAVVCHYYYYYYWWAKVGRLSRASLDKYLNEDPKLFYLC